MGGQAAQVMDNVEAVLEAAGMDLSDVVRYDVHTTDLQAYFAQGHETVVKRLGQTGRFPAGGIATEVPALAMPHMLLEVTVIAAR
jgi:enamine deaminase RidA (YjgF/YER057c/UK114 family)